MPYTFTIDRQTQIEIHQGDEPVLELRILDKVSKIAPSVNSSGAVLKIAGLTINLTTPSSQVSNVGIYNASLTAANTNAMQPGVHSGQIEFQIGAKNYVAIAINCLKVIAKLV